MNLIQQGVCQVTHEIMDAQKILVRMTQSIVYNELNHKSMLKFTAFL